MTKGGRQRGRRNVGSITGSITKGHKRAAEKRAGLQSNYMAENIIAFLCFQMVLFEDCSAPLTRRIVAAFSSPLTL